MKNNKRNLFILVPLMIAIWGGIAFQIAGGFSNDDTFAMPIQVNNKTAPLVEDTFDYSINLGYDDPFKVGRSRTYKTSKKREEPNYSTTNKKRVVSKSKEQLVQWPQIKYGGTIKSSNNKVVGLLTISGRSYLVKSDQVVNEINVLQFSDSEITVEYKNETKTILK